MRLLPISVGILALLLVAQLASKWEAKGSDFPVPTIGAEIPDVHLTDASGTAGSSMLADVLAQTPGCDVVVLASAYCSHCQRYQLTWDQTYQAWSDSVGHEIDAIWIFREQPSVVADFFGSRKLTNVSSWSLGQDAAQSWKRLGVFVTPTTYLVDQLGIIRSGGQGTKLPPSSEASITCEG